jgi:hypothetical protein
MIKMAIVFGSAWFVGLLIAYFDLAWFFGQWKWAFFALALIIGVKPSWKMLFGARAAEGLPEIKAKKKATKRKVKRK